MREVSHRHLTENMSHQVPDYRALPKGRWLIDQLKSLASQRALSEDEVLVLINKHAAKPWDLDDVRRFFSSGQAVFTLKDGIVGLTDYDESEEFRWTSDEDEPPDPKHSGSSSRLAKPGAISSSLRSLKLAKDTESKCDSKHVEQSASHRSTEEPVSRSVSGCSRCKSLREEIRKYQDGILRVDRSIDDAEEEICRLERDLRGSDTLGLLERRRCEWRENEGDSLDSKHSANALLPEGGDSSSTASRNTNPKPVATYRDDSTFGNEESEAFLKKKATRGTQHKDYYEVEDGIENEESDLIEPERILKKLMSSATLSKDEWARYLMVFLKSEGYSLEALSSGSIVAALLSIELADLKRDYLRSIEAPDCDFIESLYRYIPC